MENDCFTHDRDMMPVDDALDLLRERVGCVVQCEQVALSDASGRILAEDIVSSHSVPPFDNSGVDGYGVRSRDLSGPKLVVQDVVEAGDSRNIVLEEGKAIRIMTGARVPDSVDTIIMLEDAATTDGELSFRGNIATGSNIRRKGEDIQTGERVLVKGRRLTAADVGLLSSLGYENVQVFQNLRVILLSTGNEVRKPGSTLQSGEIFDVNRPMLLALYNSIGFEVTDGGILEDDYDLIAARLAELSEEFDVIITSGGASMGDKDFVAKSISDVGTLSAWRIAVKPGRPLGFGQISRTNGENSVVMILPGNPVAAAVCSLIFLRPALEKMAGGQWTEPMRFHMPVGFSMDKKPGRREFLRVRIERGELVRAGKQGSGMLKTLGHADGLLDLADDLTSFEIGDLLPYIPFASFAQRPV